MLHEIQRRIGQRVRRGARKAAVVGVVGLLAAGVITPLSGFTMASSSVCGATDTACVIAFGNARIAERQTALSKLNGRVTEVNTDGRISSADNAALVGDISTNESGLTTLKGQLDGAGDAKTARDDVKLIYTQFRIFAVVLPRDYHELWLDMLTHADARLAGAEPIIQDAINGAPSSVQSQANTLFTDYKSQVSNEQAQTQAANGIIPQLSPASFNANPGAYATTFGFFKTDIQSAGAATKQTMSDLRQIVQLLKSAGAATPSA
jgi:hypothetical protein